MQAKKQDLKLIGRLKKRSDFLRVQTAQKKWISKSVILQVCETQDSRHYGLTVSKRTSKRAVDRNRIKRRLRAAALETLPFCAKDKFDYVLIGRPATLEADYETLKKDLLWCLKRIGCMQGSES